MHGKEFVLDCIRTFFTVVTLINIVMFVLGVYLMPDHRFGYEAFIVPVIYGLAGTLPNAVMYSKRELKVGELIVRKVLQVILVEVFVLFAAFFGDGKEVQSIEIVGSTAVSILLIFMIATLLDWLQNSLAAKQMTEDLKKFQEGIQE